MKPIKPRQIEAFRAAMLHGSASAAAESLFITQPAVSRLISDLESAIKFRLFERKGRGLVATEDARRLFKTVEQVYEGFDVVKDVAASIRDGELGQLRVGALPIYADGLLASQIGRFIALNSGIKLELDIADRNDLLSGLVSRKFDLVISTIPTGKSAFREIKIGTRDAVCILPKTHPLANESKIGLNAISDENFIGLLATNPFSQVIKKMVNDSGGSLREVASVNTQRTAGLMVEAGAGISIVDPDVCRYLDDTLIAVRRIEPRMSWQFGVIQLDRYQSSVAATRLIRHLSETV